MMTRRYVVRGQAVTQEKIELAKKLRRDMTEAERTLWQSLRANHLDGLHFRRQQIIDGYIVDFYCFRTGLVVEVDGDIHDLQIEDDEARETALTRRGLHVIRFRNDEVLTQLPDVLQRIRMACREFSTEGGAPPPLQGEGPGERSGEPR